MKSERTYSGSGTFLTTFHGQLDPETDRGRAIAELEFFFPAWEDNLGYEPTFEAEAVGTSTRTSYHYSDGECVATTQDVGHWFSPPWGATAAPGTIVESERGLGVQFDYRFTRDESDADTIDTTETRIVGSLLPTRG